MNTTAPATIAHFEGLGRKAHEAGQPSAPALNAEVIAALEGLAVGDPNGMAIMKAYARGYEAGRDAEIALLLA